MLQEAKHGDAIAMLLTAGLGEAQHGRAEHHATDAKPQIDPKSGYVLPPHSRRRA